MKDILITLQHHSTFKLSYYFLIQFIFLNSITFSNLFSPIAFPLLIYYFLF